MPKVSKKELDGLFDGLLDSLDHIIKQSKLDAIIEKYVKRVKPATIQEVLDVFNEIAPEVDFSERYETCISKQCGRIDMLNHLIFLKKLKTKRADLDIIINQLELETEQLRNISKEVKK